MLCIGRLIQSRSLAALPVQNFTGISPCSALSRHNAGLRRPFVRIIKGSGCWTVMDPDAARTVRESLDLAFHMSNILDTGLDRHTLSILIGLCDLGLNPEALAAVVKELRREPPAPVSAPAPPS